MSAQIIPGKDLHVMKGRAREQQKERNLYFRRKRENRGRVKVLNELRYPTKALLVLDNLRSVLEISVQ